MRYLLLLCLFTVACKEPTAPGETAPQKIVLDGVVLDAYPQFVGETSLRLRVFQHVGETKFVSGAMPAVPASGTAWFLTDTLQNRVYSGYIETGIGEIITTFQIETYTPGEGYPAERKTLTGYGDTLRFFVRYLF